ncbi:hypothetical protein GUITHDRAFT_119177 [Guillardia theta CCMP2712]|uniref:SbsA Ig-like domain-containing protein n=1 Tax=Guillardia theta (strain CCMP2712) TaxID=905079 RepID=L1IED2_GUITC|nr:hypothetical protein GUITHDRAFT_119177 [Guillardia theta CCMP2712]EKX34631.1 hypothetical protein GUITHDRAFT_119177 [Guillardia theta CCMP2712]|eukprot:XP_005821611.1 hypothetical protein GUITHDRAFT_119177 [Guillardia theta CCMP2712]
MKACIAAFLLLAAASVNARKCTSCWLTSLQCSPVAPLSSSDDTTKWAATSSCTYGYSDGTYAVLSDHDSGLEPLVFTAAIYSGCGKKSYLDPKGPQGYCNKTAITGKTDSKILFGQINTLDAATIKAVCTNSGYCTTDPAGTAVYFSNHVGYTATIPFISSTGMRVFAIVYVNDPETAGDIQMVELKFPALDSKTKNVSTWKPVVVTDSVYSTNTRGVFQPSGGSLTPWCTAIGGEKAPDANSNTIKQYFTTKSPLPTSLNYGWVTESRVEIDFSASVLKRYALGRIQATSTFAMPDKKTVYLSDGHVLYMFVSKIAKDLRNGTLYAAQLSKEKVTWIKLNSANESDLAVESKKTTTWTDYWDGADFVDPTATSKTCPTGYSKVSSFTDKCYKMKSGKEKFACFLFPRDCAMVNGATTTLSVTGLAYNMDDKGATGKELGLKKFFVSFSEVSTGMQQSLGGASVVRPCGSVYMFSVGAVDACHIKVSKACTDDEAAKAKKSPITSYGLTTYKVDVVNGLPLVSDNTRCEPSLPARPSYIHFASYHNTLFIADGSGHDSNHVWLLDFSGQGRPFMPSSIFRAPKGQMIEGVSWLNNLVGDGRSYLSISVGGGTVQKGFIGYLGPFTLKGYNAGSYDMLTNIGCPIRGEQDYLYEATKYVDPLVKPAA